MDYATCMNIFAHLNFCWLNQTQEPGKRMSPSVNIVWIAIIFTITTGGWDTLFSACDRFFPSVIPNKRQERFFEPRKGKSQIASWVFANFWNPSPRRLFQIPRNRIETTARRQKLTELIGCFSNRGQYSRNSCWSASCCRNCRNHYQLSLQDVYLWS